ncbi:ANTAR domain-containing protein [Streptomyces sp. NPDC127119]|uniref:ANTAR domain-containing protein n=1 Tax=Streptomyces sp. NPDC127119 TaxID=3345370 RepID=UPI00363E60CE
MPFGEGTGQLTAQVRRLAAFDGHDLLDLLYDLTVQVLAFLPVDAAGVTLLIDTTGPVPVAASDERCWRLLTAEHDLGEGQTIDSAPGHSPRTHTPPNGNSFPVLTSLAPDSPGAQRWPYFADQARQEGVREPPPSCWDQHERRLAVLTLHTAKPRPFTTYDTAPARLLADACTQAMLRRQPDGRMPAWQRRTADNSIIIEQAKGVLAQRHGLHLDDATKQLRRQALADNRTLTATATGIVRSTPHDPLADRARDSVNGDCCRPPHKAVKTPC